MLSFLAESPPSLPFSPFLLLRARAGVLLLGVGLIFCLFPFFALVGVSSDVDIDTIRCDVLFYERGVPAIFPRWAGRRFPPLRGK